jgi:hypothetical protein
MVGGMTAVPLARRWRRVFPYLLAAALLCFPRRAAAQWVTNHLALPQPGIPKPPALAPFTDPVFGNGITRVTDAAAAGWIGAFPDYSKRQAWNADETLLLLKINNGDDLAVLDAATYQVRHVIPGIGASQDVFWHPFDPAHLFYNLEATLWVREALTDLPPATVWTFGDYTFADTAAEGNLSRDARFYAVYAHNDAPATPHDASILVDLAAKRELGRLDVPTNLQAFDWISVSPLGKYVVVDYATDLDAPFNGVEVYDQAFHLRWRKPLGAGHSDMGVDADGSEVLVMDVYNNDTNLTDIRKFRLSDGAETLLLSIQVFDQHISCRNESNAGWCFVSTFDYVDRLTDSPADWEPFEDEVFALKLDGSGEVRRLAHHHSRRYSPTTPDPDASVYFAEPHATVDRSGTKVLFGSNWRIDVGEARAIDAYVVEFAAPPPSITITPTNGAVVLSWPLASNDYRLEVSDELPALSWQPAAVAVRTNDDRIVAVLPETRSRRFARLVKP